MINTLDNVKVAIFDPDKDSWNRIGQDIMAIERSAFGHLAIAEAELRAYFEDKNDVVVLLVDNNKIIGYTFAIPDTELDPSTIAHIDSAAILPTYRGRGLIWKLNDALEEQLRLRGYKYYTERATQANGFVEKIEKHYGDRIVEKFDVVSKFGFGPQRHFKIRL